MLQGINLTLMIGPAIPIIAPKVVVEALTSVQVTNSKDNSGFQLVFTIGKDSPILTSMLPAGYFDPILTRVIIVVTLNGMPHVLMDGLVTNQQFAPSNEPGKSILTIIGEDLSIAMDLIEIIAPFTAMPDVAKLYLRLAPYLAFGVIPLVIPPSISPIKPPTSGWTSQAKVTDKALFKDLAQKVGYIFVVEPGPLVGQSIAYFGPNVNLPIPQKALTINLDSQSNIEALSFSLNGTAKQVRVFTIFDPVTGKIPIPIPLPNINFLKPPLGARPLLPSKIEFEKEGSQLQMADALQKILGFMMNTPPSVTANGSLDVMRYKGILRARMLVGVRGAGITYDGLYYVDTVTHNIKKGEYKQSFTLSRDGLVSNTPFLPV